MNIDFRFWFPFAMGIASLLLTPFVPEFYMVTAFALGLIFGRNQE